MTQSSDSAATRTSLIARAQQQDPEAWRSLVGLYGPLIAHWCQRYGLDASRTADCVQEVFASVSRSLDRYEPRRAQGSFRAWLWTITANQIKDRYRQTQLHLQGKGGSTALGKLHEIPDPNQLPEEDPTNDQQMSELISRATEQVRGEFEPKTWDIFRRAIIDQIPTQVVADEFGVSAAAVRQVRSRILRRLRQQLGDLEPGPE